MVPTAALLAAVISSYAVLGGAFYALVHVQGRRLDDVGLRLDRLSTRVDDRFDRSDGRFDRVESELAGLKAAVAVLESRLEH